jgi:Leucine-rich repeat (LRR) protein
MLNLKVAREFDQALQKVHDLPQSTFGQDNYVKTLETLVTSEGRNAAPRYVGVWGMGGVGKTLLLQRVDGSPTVRGHFQGAMFIWLFVGQTPDIMALYRTLSKKLNLDPELHANPEDFKRYLHTQFVQRRVFLVLDDVWKDKAFDSLNLAKGKGSVTMLSTRNQSLLGRASPHITQVPMTRLSEKDSWSLFCVHAFGEPSNVPSEVEVFAQSVAEECKGVPLALKVIGRAMYGKTSPELQWEPVLKKLEQSRMQEPIVEEDLYDCLKLGYDILSQDDERLKDCFLHFAAFPEDHQFSFTDIFCHWVGEGWIPGNGEDDPRADAFSLLKKLCERSLIESIQLAEELVVGDEYEMRFKIHDVMRDVAFYILKNDSGKPPAELLYLYRAGQNLEEIPRELEGTLEKPSKVRRLSLYQNDLQNLPENLYAPELVCLLLGRNPLYNLDHSLNSFPKLRILNLENGKFSSLPKELGELKNLVYLNLSVCFYLQTIPDTVRNLHKLRCLMIYSCYSLEYLPSGVVGLTSLQKLDTSHCENLRWAEHTSSSTARAKFPNHEYATSRASIEDICKLSALTELSLEVGKIPLNISALKNLKMLDLGLENVTSLPENMPYWWKQLQHLHIVNVFSLKYFPKSFTSRGAFPALINLKINCTRLVEFPDVEDGALSKLRKLQFVCCHSLKTLPLSLNRLTSLKKLILDVYTQTLYDSCMQNCDKAPIWRPPIFTCFYMID